MKKKVKTILTLQLLLIIKWKVTVPHSKKAL